MATTIYALCDPDLKIPVIRYIGMTRNLPKRITSHRSTSIKSKTHLGCWLRSLKNRGEEPVLLTLTEVSDELGHAAETLYIKLAREGGMDLVNATDGGEGSSAWNPLVRDRLSAHQLGENNHQFGKCGIANPFFGKTHSEEQKAKWSRERKGQRIGIPVPPEVVARGAATRRGRKRPGASSRYIGVYWFPRNQKWRAEVRVPGKKRVYLGGFDLEIDAAKAFDEAALRILGPDAKINFTVSCCGSGT